MYNLLFVIILTLQIIPTILMDKLQDVVVFMSYDVATSSIIVLQATCIYSSIKDKKGCTRILVSAILLISIAFWGYNLLLIFAPEYIPKYEIPQLPKWISYG